MFRCIYCPRTSERKFRPEHVIPKALGKFRGNLTVFTVCDGCNEYFGEGIERQLLRDSIWALWRLGSGLKPPDEANEVGGRRLKTVVRDGPLKGAPVRLAGSDGKIIREYEPLVAFLREDGEYDWFRPGDLTHQIVEGYRPWNHINIYGAQEHIDRMTELLREFGIAVGDSESSAQAEPVGHVVSTFTVEDLDLRVIAKIAFNYAARFLPADFLLRRDFDEFRRFVRYGEESTRPLIREIDGPILASAGEHRTAGRNHIVVMDWDTSHRQILVLVSLFNAVSFETILCSSYSGVWFPVVSGHVFDISAKRLVRLIAMPRRRHS